MAEYRRRFGRIAIVFLALVFLALLAVPQVAKATDDRAVGRSQPNVLFFLSDDQRADTIRALGNKHIETPNLDRLVERGTVFGSAYCMGAQHGAVCVPSRAMLLSGRSLFRVKENLADTRTWPEQFAAAGYATFATGKWHNGAESLVRVFDSGEAIFLGGMTDPYAAKLVDFAHGDESAKKKLTPPRTTERHCVEAFADAAIGFLRRQDGKRPFLCFVALNAPHDPCIVPKDFAIRYDAAKLPLPGNFLPLHPFDNGEMWVRDEKLLPWPRAEDAVRRNLAEYYRAVSFVDAQVGRVLAELKNRGLEENTLVVFASDHGLAVGSHGLMGKQNLYEHSMRAPLVVAGPGVKAGQRTDAMCYLFDILPTLGDLCGIAAPEESEGQSLRAVLTGESPTARKEIFTAYRDVQRAIRDDRWKLIRYPKIDKTQLFDLADDPEETRDLAGDERFREHQQRLFERMQAAQKEYADSAPLVVDSPADGRWDSSDLPETANPQQSK